MSKRSFRIALGVVVVSFVVALGVGLYLADRALAYPETRHRGDSEAIEVTVPRGASFPRIARVLHERGVIDRPRWFRLYAMHRGVTTKVRRGTYTLRGDMTPREVLDTLLAGVEEASVRVTIPEGLHLLEVLAILDQAGVADADALEALARDPDFLTARGIDGETIDGYLFPDTYQFRVPTGPEDVLDRLLERHRVVWDQIRRTHAKKVERLRARLGWTDRDILVMASIVEKEAAAASERPRIAQVFINRLTSPTFKPRRLETDPTIRYGCTVPLDKSDGCKKWDPSQRLRRAQLDDQDNPYNTYQHEGLPPGPICNPGAAALEATVNPDGSGYFFFVARNDGTHVFSRTVQEHERAVDKYQR
ncbi:endolytic transglycosylase MltG [Haliangium sp.]|uniref:endolytic transglycosylase MltG n=1 Tax=Haliangium sp. TaxID=2663208 RepID=UPI003D0D75D4